MSACCPAAIGTEAASICTEHATATIAGASLSLPMLLAGALAVGVVVIALRALRRTTRGWIQPKHPTLA